MIRLRPLALVFALAACSRASPPAPAAGAAASTSDDAPSTALPTSYMGRTLAAPMSYRGADWLERPEREEEEKPEVVLDALGVAPGSVVADVGTGSGYFAIRLGRRVGPTGRVLATDLQPEMLSLLRTRIAAIGLANIEPVLATAGDAKLPRGALDLVLMVDVYHELPDPPGTLAQVRSALRAGGRLALVEYRAEDPAVPIKPEHKMTLVQIRRELEANGFVFDRADERLPSQRIVVFRVGGG